MRVPRIYHPAPLHAGSLQLDAQASLHISKVLRLRVDAPIVIFDGRGSVYAGSIQHFQGKHVIVKLDTRLAEDNESPLPTHLAFAVLKGDRMSFALQKAVELGVAEITPVITEHTVVKLDEQRQHNKLEHWQSIIHNAAEQSQRSRLPALHAPVEVGEWLAHCNADLKIYFDAGAAATLSTLTSNPPKQVALLIGPEGGLSTSECRGAETAGFHGVRLGKRILRAETAVIAALSAVQTCWGDFG